MLKDHWMKGLSLRHGVIRSTKYQRGYPRPTDAKERTYRIYNAREVILLKIGTKVQAGTR